jgi:hypothetical protein
MPPHRRRQPAFLLVQCTNEVASPPFFQQSSDITAGANRRSCWFSAPTRLHPLPFSSNPRTSPPLLAFLGFDPANAEPDASARQALRWVFILMPMLVVSIAAYLLYSFRLDENLQRDLRRMIEERDAGSP